MNIIFKNRLLSMIRQRRVFGRLLKTLVTMVRLKKMVIITGFCVLGSIIMEIYWK